MPQMQCQHEIPYKLPYCSLRQIPALEFYSTKKKSSGGSYTAKNLTQLVFAGKQFEIRPYHFSMKFSIMAIDQMTIKSSAFKEGARLPRRYTCNGDNINPPLEILDAPYGTRSFAVIMDDPDAPGGLFTHWITWNLPPEIELQEGKLHTMCGTNSAGRAGYFGPCPPEGIHRYYFRVYALDRGLLIENGASREQLEKEMSGHILASGSLMGIYERVNKDASK
jgi:Raf kinase inhibitor-like YbhB/YbcL family protein